MTRWNCKHIWDFIMYIEPSWWFFTTRVQLMTQTVSQVICWGWDIHRFLLASTSFSIRPSLCLPQGHFRTQKYEGEENLNGFSKANILLCWKHTRCTMPQPAIVQNLRYLEKLWAEDLKSSSDRWGRPFNQEPDHPDSDKTKDICNQLIRRRR